MTRRELLELAGAMGAAPLNAAGAGAEYRWIRPARILIAEGYNSPFYPEFSYDAEKALHIARRLNASALRFPAAAYRAFFPTETKYPRHSQLGSRDPLGETVEAFHKAGLKVVVYVPFNHPFMSTDSLRPEYEDWCKRYSDGKPMITGHYGYGTFYEGCMNSPVRRVISDLIREVVTRYAVDVVYFDGPYQGMQHQDEFCHCKYCESAYAAARGKPVPTQDGKLPLAEEAEYRDWLRDDIITGAMRQARELIRGLRDVPVLYNNTGLLAWHGWRSRAWVAVDGFMFEHAQSSQQKLFNMALGQSTGKTIWTYVGSYSVYNPEHLADRSVGWRSWPVEGQELLLDGATAIAAGAGLKYWGLSRFYHVPEDPLAYESGRYVRELFDFSQKHEALLTSVKPVYRAGILVGSQTLDWYAGKVFVRGAHENGYYGANQVLKDLCYDAEPFLDYRMSPERLAKYPLVFAPNAVCLSKAQCDALRGYVENGGTLIATHLTSAADEYGRQLGNFQLSDLFQATLREPEPVEMTELYLRQLPSGAMMPQDLQIALFEKGAGAELLAETYDIGRRRVVGPAVVRSRHGKGTAIYIGSSLEAVYEESRVAAVLDYLRSFIDPVLGSLRTYEFDARPGLAGRFARSETDLLLHILASTGDKWKKAPVREQFVPLDNVKVRIRLPQGRAVKSVTLLRANRKEPWTIRAGWVELAVPQLFIHEAVRVELV